MKTMSYSQFEQLYFRALMQAPDYRLGQCFIYYFVRDSSTPEMLRLWNEKDLDTARKMIYSIIERYHWDINELQILDGRELYFD
ncbi:hypothetical protein [Vibrio phage JSF13]|jgi:hypothetical protein|uniref:Uncharacterized protein ORF64 n=1 Tax=Vibrio phage ICP1 TaxID=979525 RepID=F1D186_9CAUD|nr:hypothetical protein ViPhICP1_gp064 [Vibrio phage ICP1]ADX88107.1 hypothetical protein TUST1-191_00305 [Vibrio phage ICP1_2006_D]ADX88334.1 hypothetical protein TUST1-182_00305 [Vibrio phage ICP1_2006_C]ADX88561.1 hypothetical protein TUST1-159_00305 [Vibrio phage ICP1_2006_B]ADX88787.1 hypothetical protein TUST1-17_00305 [Vibrio phage ICP1_2006_A]ADX89013.1 hypothetical protein TUST1-15_00305 [Vibrio phage ICP1_2005_A]ADX89245.1 hypothetical protein TUST1-2_00315 [Vibrio phage ICP1_2001_A